MPFGWALPIIRGALKTQKLSENFRIKGIEMFFENREEAGRLLAKQLYDLKNKQNVIVLALPRGGVPVAYEIAKELKVPLDIFFVKKIPSPYNEEAGIGAVTENGLLQLNQEAVNYLKVTNEYIKKRAKEKIENMTKKRALYKRNLPNLKDKIVILADDGIATGSSMILAVKALKDMGAKEIIIASPVAPSELKEVLQSVADRVEVLHFDDNLMAVGRFYSDFHQLSDDEVIKLLT